MSNNMGVTQLTPAMVNPEVAVNTALGRFDSFLTEALNVSLASTNQSVTLSQLQQCYRINATGATVAGRTVTLAAMKRMALIHSDSANTQDVGFKVGTTTITLVPGESMMVALDGTANGLTQVLATGSSASAVRDLIASFLVAGTGVTLTRGSSPDHLTIASSGGGGGGSGTPDAKYSWPGYVNGNDTGAFASLGNVLLLTDNIQVTKTRAAFNNATIGNVYTMSIVVINSSGVIQSTLATSSTPFTTVATGLQTRDFDFTSPVTLAAGTYYALLLIVTNGTGTTPARPAGSNTQSYPNLPMDVGALLANGNFLASGARIWYTQNSASPSSGSPAGSNTGMYGLGLKWQNPTGGGGGSSFVPTCRLTPVVPNSASNFTTWVNQNSAVITDLSDAMRLSHAGVATGASNSCRVKSLPAGTSWTVTLGTICGVPFKNFFSAGLVLRESATGKLNTFGFAPPNGPAYHLNKWTNPTTFSAELTHGGQFAPVTFFRAIRNGTALEFWMSYDGVQYFLFVSTTVTAFFTTEPDQWGIYIDPNNNGVTPTAAGSLDAFHWSQV